MNVLKGTSRRIGAGLAKGVHGVESWTGRQAWQKKEAVFIAQEMEKKFGSEKEVPIGGRQSKIKDLWNKMSKAEQKKYDDMANTWNTEGTPKDIMTRSVLVSP